MLQAARCVVGACALAATAHGAEAPDRVFVGGRVWTAERSAEWAEAVVVRGDRIVFVGSKSAALRMAGPTTEMVDLEGRLVVPGFNDAHLHLLALEKVEVDAARDVAEVQQRIREYGAAHAEAAWITGRGWAYAQFPGSVPHRRHVDAAMPDRPLVLSDRDGHAALANTKALAAAGITRETKDPPGGIIVRDADGEATGLLKEEAMSLVDAHVPPPSTDALYRTLKKRVAQAASYGLTSVQNASPIDRPTYERLLKEGGLNVRVYACESLPKAPTAADVARLRAARDAFRGPHLKLGCLKGLLDGTIDSKTAWMFEPYVGGGSGLPLWTQAEVDRSVALFDKEGFQVFLHAIGDRAIHMALDAYEKAAKTNGTTGRRHRVEHVELPLVSDLQRFRRLGVIASTQALFANPDKNVLENFSVVLGPERASRADAFRMFDDAKITQAFGSDWPVFPMEVLKGVYAAVARKTPEGTPPDGWYPKNRIDVDQALRHFTTDAAFASFDEKEKGTLAPGKLADFVVLSEDVFQPPVERILKTKVLLTVMGGRDTFRAKEF